MALIHWVGTPRFSSMEQVMLDSMRRPACLEDLVLPNVDISEDQENFYIISELPGMKDDDVKITVDGSMLTMSGCTGHKDDKQNRRFHRIERVTGEFVRSFSIPKNVKASAISGTFHDGLLELTLPKITQDAVMREIPLNGASTNTTPTEKPFVKSNGHIKSEEKAGLA